MVTAPYKPQHEFSEPYDEDEAITWTNAGNFLWQPLPAHKLASPLLATCAHVPLVMLYEALPAASRACAVPSKSHCTKADLVVES
jgi:hypothetical protein